MEILGVLDRIFLSRGHSLSPHAASNGDLYREAWNRTRKSMFAIEKLPSAIPSTYRPTNP